MHGLMLAFLFAYMIKFHFCVKRYYRLEGGNVPLEKITANKIL